MAKLPPKFPTNMTPTIPSTWPSFPHNHHHHHQHNLPRPPSMPSLSPESASHPSWIDDFFDFSSAKRGAHRRTVSDSITFYESAAVASSDGSDATHARDPSAPGGPPASSSTEFDRLDDEQLMSMFSDDVTPPSSALPSTAPSTPSDHNSNSEQDKRTPPSYGSDQSEAQSECNAQQLHSPAGTETAPAQPSDTPLPIADPKRVKRILANRQSAQRSRIRKLQYISELERCVTTLQTEVSALSPRVAFLDHQRSVLSVGNSHLKQRIAALAQDKIFKDAHQEALHGEIERLRQLAYNQQNLKKISADGAPLAAGKELNISDCTDHDPSRES
ncbi:Transcription factor VIP1 [Platanthera zijinensis]|uniref:Transcription factor VIP1 n=1 Tax=Platanthera zijinensis TaxID=2320716 RepID=A0AAP0BR53_9ASPA